MLNDLFWIVPVCAIIALLFARIFFKGMMKESEGTDTMKRIAGHVRKGAMAYLRQQYRVVALVFLVLCVLFAWMAYGPGLQNPWVWFAFLTGGFLLWIGRVYRDENSYLRISKNGQRCT